MTKSENSNQELRQVRFVLERLPNLAKLLNEQSLKTSHQLGVWLVVGNILTAGFAIKGSYAHADESQIKPILELTSGFGLGALSAFLSLYISATVMVLVAGRITTLELLVSRLIDSNKNHSTWESIAERYSNNDAPAEVMRNILAAQTEINTLNQDIQKKSKPFWIALAAWVLAAILSIASIVFLLCTSQKILNVLISTPATT